MQTNNSESISNSLDASLDRLANAIVAAACEKALAKLNTEAMKPSEVSTKPRLWLADDVDSVISGLRQIAEGNNVDLKEINNDQNTDLDVLVDFLRKEEDGTQKH